jgi:hypothetical protein
MTGENLVDKRVVFDFAVQFSNGGGLQGQGFRLDIDGDTMSDDALAASIIRDLRGFTFSAAPPKIVAMGTFPVRAHAILTTANT